jgi:uncharacterized protein YcfL
MKTLSPLLAALSALLLAAGCSSTPKQDIYTPQNGPNLPLQEATRYSIESTEKFVLMDPATQNSVTCTGLQERVTADGRLETVANVKNLEGRRIEVQISCVFKDAQHMPTGDETPWQTLILGENETQAVRFTSMNNLAKTYTIRVRQSR